MPGHSSPRHLRRILSLKRGPGLVMLLSTQGRETCGRSRRPSDATRSSLRLGVDFPLAMPAAAGSLAVGEACEFDRRIYFPASARLVRQTTGLEHRVFAERVMRERRRRGLRPAAGLQRRLRFPLVCADMPVAGQQCADSRCLHAQVLRARSLRNGLTRRRLAACAPTPRRLAAGRGSSWSSTRHVAWRYPLPCAQTQWASACAKERSKGSSAA